MLRQAFADRLKQAMKAREAGTVSAVRLILAGLKDRDVAARTEGKPEPIGEPEIARMLQAMIKQRRESIALYERATAPTSPRRSVTRSRSSKAFCRAR